MPTILVVDVEPQKCEEYSVINVFHSFVNAIPIWEETCLLCGSGSDVKAMLDGFILQKSHLFSRFKASPIETDLHTHAQQILAEFPLNSSFGLTIAVFSTRGDEIENAFESAISVANSACILKVFSLTNSNTNQLKEMVLDFCRLHYKPTECVIEFGVFVCKLNLFPSYHSLSDRIRDEFVVSAKWNLSHFGPSVDATGTVSKLKFKVDFIKSEDNYLQTFIVQSLLSQLESVNNTFIMHDSSNNRASLSRSGCGRFIIFRLLDFFPLPHEQQTIQDSKTASPASYVTCNAPNAFPYWNEESIADLFQKLVKAAQEMDESKFLQLFNKFQSIVVVYKPVHLVDELEEILLLEGADTKFVDLNNDLKSKILGQL